MTATEELRARLNARGIHWERNETLDIVGRDIATVYRANHAEWIAFEDTDVDLNPTGNGINVTNYRKPLTPEQAIEATLGRGTCRFVTVIDQDPSRRHRGNICECDGCGYQCARGFIEDERFNFCPNCGRRVEQ